MKAVKKTTEAIIKLGEEMSRASMTGEEFLNILEIRTNTPEFRKFNMWDYYKGHIVLYQDFNKCSFYLGISHSNDDEYNWIFGFTFMFWGIEIMWNGRNYFRSKFYRLKALYRIKFKNEMPF